MIRKLKITEELLLQFFKNPLPTNVTIIKDVLPKDSKIIQINKLDNDIIEFWISSNEFINDEPLIPWYNENKPNR